MTTPKPKRERYTDEEFKSPEELQAFFRAGHTLKYDYVVVGKILFTMEEYDSDGQYIVFANRKHGSQIRIDTVNRYGAAGFTDAKVYQWPADSWRNDIVYAE